MAVGKLTKTSIEAAYTESSEHESQLGVRSSILSFLNLLFFISQAEEVTGINDFFSGRSLPIVEYFENLNASYELIKMGMNKQAFISLRVGLDNGLIAVYWKAVGERTAQFKKWLSSNDPTPRRDRAFWRAIASIPSVRTFCAQFPLQADVQRLEKLSDYVHTKGVSYSTLTDLQRRIRSGNPHFHFDTWWPQFKAVARVVVILQLLVRPKLAVPIPDALLLPKFGTYDKVPFTGALIADYSADMISLIGEEEYRAVRNLADRSSDVKTLLEQLSTLPDLPPETIDKIIFEEQKQHVLERGFYEWRKNCKSYEHRIDDKMILRIHS